MRTNLFCIICFNVNAKGFEQYKAKQFIIELDIPFIDKDSAGGIIATDLNGDARSVI